MDKCLLFNTFFRDQTGVKLLEEFFTGNEFIIGKIQIDTAKEPLLFNVEAPLSYPLSNSPLSIRFVCTNVDGFLHLNWDGSVCIHPEKNHDPAEKLINEFSLLKRWIQDYYIEEKTDSHYEYLITPFADGAKFLFTDISANFKKGDQGLFEYSQLTEPIFHGTMLVQHPLIIQKIGEHECCWGTFYKTLPKFKSFWFFIETAPVIYRRKIITNWEDFEKYLSPTQLKTIHELHGKTGQNHIFDYPILIGYKIPTTNGNEIHWQMIKIPSNQIPTYGEKAEKKWVGKCQDQQIKWVCTINSSYHRFFGRGGLCTKLADSKILILGCGAIGSSLAEILTRGGLQDLTLMDFDFVEAGNICRSAFEFNQIGYPKTFALEQKIRMISPFINIRSIQNHIDKRIDKPNKTNTLKFLNQFDYIFDCTTDMELCYVLDILLPTSKIFNFSISNKAKEFVCVTGRGNITETKAHLFPVDEDKPLFYEGTGCWDPTFEASYFDINCYLNLAIKNINDKIKKKLNATTFVIKTEMNDEVLNFELIDY
ncbi:MAG TPA: ThiF family adenylyltransferase [Bacteroidia bacterium]|jgi:hypothetical protein|nr:ThiF family adenylyltransferase [Bacteroidia bacterium]